MAGVAGDFGERMRQLTERVGAGHLVLNVVVDQIYAKYQELREDLNHPSGGRAHALQQSLYEQLDQIMRDLADGLLDEDGLQEAGRKAVERIAQRYYETAPFEFGDLRASPHPTVTDGGGLVYDRPPGVHRLTTDELREKGILRDLGFGHELSHTEILAALGAG